MVARSATFLGIHAYYNAYSSGLQNMYARYGFFNFLYVRIAEMHFSTALHLVDCHVQFRSYRHMKHTDKSWSIRSSFYGLDLEQI